MFCLSGQTLLINFEITMAGVENYSIISAVDAKTAPIPYECLWI